MRKRKETFGTKLTSLDYPVRIRELVMNIVIHSLIHSFTYIYNPGTTMDM